MYIYVPKGVAMKKLSLLLLFIPILGFAESPSGNWSGSYNFPSSSSSNTRLLQADLIAKMNGGYYDSFGPARISINTTTTAGTIINNNTEITGDDNNVVQDGTGLNSGNLNGSINFTTGSTISSSDINESNFNLTRTNDTIDEQIP
jgi:hypothetical protein